MNMKFAVVALTALLASPLVAQQAKPEGKGVLNKADPAAHKLNITHEAIPALHWPGMTMDFQAAPALDLSALKVGAKIRFVLARDANGMYVIEQIRPDE